MMITRLVLERLILIPFIGNVRSYIEVDKNSGLSDYEFMLGFQL
jgi:hypothetical protein